MLEFIFGLSVFFALYPYLVYPALTALLGVAFPRPVRRGACLPSMTIVIPAYNEANCIASTVRNKLQLDYPRECLQIVVASDGSTDGTDEIVASFAPDGVELLRVEGRGGKAVAVNGAVRQARGEILVFSDANSLFDSKALRLMAENFNDPRVGYVTGALSLQVSSDALSGHGIGAYMRYENFLRRKESQFGSIIGVNGGVDAIRRSLYSDIPRELITDFVLPLRVLAAGYRVIFDERVLASERANDETGSEFRMRVRVALRALQGLVHMRVLLNPLRYPVEAFCLISHKLIRYFGFIFLAAALAANIALALESRFFLGLLTLHIACYAIAVLGIAGILPPRARRMAVVPSYLLLSYTAFALAVLKFLRGQTMATWQPRAG